MREEANMWLQAQDSFCDSSKKPNASEICNNGPCKPEWYMSEWSRVCFLISDRSFLLYKN